MILSIMDHNPGHVTIDLVKLYLRGTRGRFKLVNNDSFKEIHFFSLHAGLNLSHKSRCCLIFKIHAEIYKSFT